MGTRSFPVVERPGRGGDYPPPSKCRGHERVGPTPLLTLWAFVACYRENLYLYALISVMTLWPFLEIATELEKNVKLHK